MARRATKSNGSGRGASADPAPADTAVNERTLAEAALNEGKADEGVLCVPPPKKETGKANGKGDTTTVADIPITDGEDQSVVSDGPIGEPKVNKRGTRGKQAVRRPQSASDGRKTSASSASKTPRKRGTARQGTQKSPQAKKGAVTGGKDSKRGQKSASGAKVKKPSSTITMAELAESYAKHLEAAGKSGGTVHSYSIELKTAIRYFGPETKVASLTAKKVGEYFDSDQVVKNRKGRTKDDKTIAKTRRVLRLALTWLAEVGVIPTAPIPETKKATKKK